MNIERRSLLELRAMGLILTVLTCTTVVIAACGDSTLKETSSSEDASGDPSSDSTDSTSSTDSATMPSDTSPDTYPADTYPVDTTPIDTAPEEEPAPTVELVCTDGQDNDLDGLTDCADTDCAAEFQCTWPTSMDHHTLAEFRGNTIECQVMGFPIDTDVEDCTVDMRATITHLTEGDICPTCDRTYTGPLSYPIDSCSSMLGLPPPASQGTFGFVFVSPTQRELWGKNEAGVWERGVALTLVGSSWQFSSSEQIWGDPDECDNGNQNLGTLSVTLTFTDVN